MKRCRTMNKIQKFRELLAEQGVEMTIEQANEAFKNARNLIKKSKKISMMDLLKISSDEISDSEKDQIINLYIKAKEL